MQSNFPSLHAQSVDPEDPSAKFSGQEQLKSPPQFWLESRGGFTGHDCTGKSVGSVEIDESHKKGNPSVQWQLRLPVALLLSGPIGQVHSKSAPHIVEIKDDVSEGSVGHEVTLVTLLATSAMPTSSAEATAKTKPARASLNMVCH